VYAATPPTSKPTLHSNCCAILPLLSPQYAEIHHAACTTTMITGP